MKRGDRILRVDGRDVTNERYDNVLDVLRSLKPRDSVRLMVGRNSPSGGKTCTPQTPPEDLLPNGSQKSTKKPSPLPSA